MADMKEWLQACQSTLDGAADLAQALEEEQPFPSLWTPQAREYALMLLEDYISQWEENDDQG